MSVHIPDGYTPSFTLPLPPTIHTPPEPDHGPRILVDDIAGVTELAAEHGVTRRTVTNWTNTPGFPAPLRSLSRGDLYDAAAVRAWRDTIPDPGDGAA